MALMAAPNDKQCRQKAGRRRGKNDLRNVCAPIGPKGPATSSRPFVPLAHGRMRQRTPRGILRKIKLTIRITPVSGQFRSAAHKGQNIADAESPSWKWPKLKHRAKIQRRFCHMKVCRVKQIGVISPTPAVSGRGNSCNLHSGPETVPA